MNDKFEKLHVIYGSWAAVAKKLNKTPRQIQNYRNGYSRVSLELKFFVEHLIAADKLTK